jgi:hypothetical protein
MQPRWLIVGDIVSSFYHGFGRRWVLRSETPAAAVERVRAQIAPARLDRFTVTRATRRDVQRHLAQRLWTRDVKRGTPATSL